MRLLVIDPFYGFCGPAQFSADIFQEPIPAGSAVLLLKESPCTTDDVLREAGCEIEIISHTGMTPTMRDFPAWLRYPYDLISAGIAIVRAVRKFKPTLVFVNTELDPFAGAIAKLCSIPSIARVHAQTLGRHGWIGRLYARALGRIFDCLLCNSSSTKIYMASLGVRESKLVTLENGVNMNKFVPASPTMEGRDALGATLADFLVMCVAHHAPIKGLHVLLEAFEQFASQYPNVRLAIIGREATHTQRQYSNSLYAKVQESPVLHTRVTFSAPSYQIHRILPQADLVVQPSLSESFGRIVIEASSCGIPIVASDVGGLKETVVDGVTGWLVPPGNATALANALREAYLAPALRSKRGREGIDHAKKYNVDEIRKTFYAVCSSIEVLGN